MITLDRCPARSPWAPTRKLCQNLIHFDNTRALGCNPLEAQRIPSCARRSAFCVSRCGHTGVSFREDADFSKRGRCGLDRMVGGVDRDVGETLRCVGKPNSVVGASLSSVGKPDRVVGRPDREIDGLVRVIAAAFRWLLEPILRLEGPLDSLERASGRLELASGRLELPVHV